MLNKVIGNREPKGAVILQSHGVCTPFITTQQGLMIPFSCSFEIVDLESDEDYWIMFKELL